MKRSQGFLMICAAVFCVCLVMAMVADAVAHAQAGQRTAQAGAPPNAGFPSAYPPHPAADPAVVAQGKASYSVRCAFCHGSDARGGETGPNLLRSQLVLTDMNGENIIPVVQHGRPAGGMPPSDLAVPQILEIVTFLHSFPVSGNDRSHSDVTRIPVGDVAAGKGQFDSKCASCHTVASLQGIATRVPDPRMLQQTWLMPGARGGAQDLHIPSKRVTVTYPSGKTVSGDLHRIDDFLVTFYTADGERVTVLRNGLVPDVSLSDPLAGHTKLLTTYTDSNIHDITAYLETLK